MDNQALRPNNLFNELTSLVDKNLNPEDEVDLQIKEEEEALAYISHFKGWKILKEEISTLEEELDMMVTRAMENGASSKEIGERTIAKEIAKYAIRRLIKRVEDARESRDKDL